MVVFVTSEELFNLAEIYTFYASILSLILGIFGNMFVILIFGNLPIFRNRPCSFYLTIETIANIVLLLAIYSSRIVAFRFGQDPVHIFLYWCKIRTILTQICCLSSLAIVSLAAIDQYFSTNYHVFIRKFSTIKTAHRTSRILLLLSIIHSIPFFIFYEIRSPLGCLAYNSIFVKYQSMFYYPILLASIPLAISITFSLLAYRNVRRIIRRQIPIVRRRLDRQLTAIVLARVGCLVVLGIPYVIYSLFELHIQFNENDQYALAIKHCIEAIILSLFYANYAVTFVFVEKIESLGFRFRLIFMFI